MRRTSLILGCAGVDRTPLCPEPLTGAYGLTNQGRESLACTWGARQHDQNACVGISPDVLFAPLRDTFEFVQLVGRHDRVGRDSSHGADVAQRTDERPQPRWNCQKSAADDS